MEFEFFFFLVFACLKLMFFTPIFFNAINHFELVILMPCGLESSSNLSKFI
jgi:hypothetical protein